VKPALAEAAEMLANAVSGTLTSTAEVENATTPDGDDAASFAMAFRGSRVKVTLTCEDGPLPGEDEKDDHCGVGSAHGPHVMGVAVRCPGTTLEEELAGNGN
jgi:hypothetical protein